MGGVTSIEVKESLDDLAEQLRQVETPTAKERLQVLYWLKQDKAPVSVRLPKQLGNIATRCKLGCCDTEKAE
jgi:hypothetical protein